MSSERFLSLLGLAKRGGRLAVGEEPVEAAGAASCPPQAHRESAIASARSSAIVFFIRIVPFSFIYCRSSGKTCMDFRKCCINPAELQQYLL